MKDTLHLAGSKPLMVAHRGLSGIELENTASAFVAAGNRSYYGIETDVHRTGDGQFVVIHDDNTKRVGIDNLVVEETTYETLRALRLADKDGVRGRNDLRIPSLLEYIQICKKYGKVSVLELKNHFEPADVDQIIDIICILVLKIHSLSKKRQKTAYILYITLINGVFQELLQHCCLLAAYIFLPY